MLSGVQPPIFGWLPVWRRNFLVWKKLALPSILGNLADPLIYMLGLGYGLGQMLPNIDGQSYVAFLAAGTVCASTMNAATFESLYSAFSRMHVQKTWDAILNTGLAFAALGLIWNALAPSYDFFMYYFTLFITPMTLISGVFFPTDQLPGWLAATGGWLPLAQGVQLVRPLLAGQIPADALTHITALVAMTAAAFTVALHLTRRRLLK